MKKKQLINKSNVTTIIITILMVVIIGFITGCESENTLENEYADSEYLELDIYDKYRMKEKEFKTMNRAIQRLNIKKVEGLFKIKETSAKEINISPKLFNYITAGFNYTNSTLRPKSLSNKSKITRLKSGNNEIIFQVNDSTYCFSYSITALGDFSFNACKTKQNDLGWGDGVPVTQSTNGTYDISNALSFYKSFYQNGSIISSNSLEEGMMGGKVLFFRTGSNAHAVNAMSYDENTGLITYFDYQNNRAGWVDKNAVIAIFNKGN
ncbi:hypothetical protein [Flavicella sediminum]|uniref:hypothetical protein n=1 Tax=Flavicella sediminum TaxID=2585141 RepID=UPI0011246B3B|nr:hypothetical protein [Flavicella sediminum]